ncbi:hypothetical protein AYI70_g1142 [Smittium culicis]|uniref:Uncharacterized protein n=1 Tax=Smittium culicis TaxID=133412 RepID=A0A1R1YDV3_9FUNG|nr:hypothetical protein AYI70_g1142 [Smittium culicis]
MDDYQRHIPKSRSAFGQTVVDLVKSYLHRYSQLSSITIRRVGEDSNGLGTPENPGLKLGLSTFYNVCPKKLDKPNKIAGMFEARVAGSKAEKKYRSAVSKNHGKKYVDGHFGVLSKWFDEFESIMDITSIDDLMGIFRSKTSDFAAQRGIYTDDSGYNFIKYDQYTPR